MTHPDQLAPPQAEEVHLHDYLIVVLRRWKLVLLVAVAVFLGVAWHTYRQEPVYQAFATLQVRENRGNNILGEFQMGNKSSLATDIEILKSRTIAEKVARRLHLDWRIRPDSPKVKVKVLEFSGARDETLWRVGLTGPGAYEVKDDSGKVIGSGKVGVSLRAEGATLMLEELEGKVGDGFQLSLVPLHAAAQRIQGGIRADEVGRGTDVIRLSYQDTDPVRAKEVVNALAEVYRDQSAARKSEEAANTVAFIDRQLEDLRLGLDRSEKALREYRVSSGLKVLGPEAEAVVMKLVDLEGQDSAFDLRQRRLVYAFQTFKDVTARGEIYLPAGVPDLPLIAEMTAELSDLDGQKRALLAEYTESHPAVRELQARMEDLLGKIRSAFGAALQDLQEQRGQLGRLTGVYEEQLKRLPQAELELARLMRHAKINAESYTFLLEKREEARITRAATSGNVNIIDPALTPQWPIKPNKKKNLTLGLMLGLMLGVGLAFFLDYMDDTVKDAEEVKRLLGVPVMGLIPHMRQTSKSADPSAMKLITHHEPKSSVAEAFRSLRTGIHYSGIDKKRQVILLTSSFPHEGKSTLSANLAITLAQPGAKVVLIGCDLRRPTLHKAFGTSRTPGLTEVLVGGCDLDGVIHKTDGTGIDFINAGTTPPNPAELLGSAAMREVLDALRQRYDHVLIDAPPVLAVTDAHVLTSMADMVLVVKEAGRVPRKVALLVQESLRNVGAPVAGVILNDKSGKGSEYYGYGYGYGYRYGYGYGYGYYGEEEQHAKKRKFWRKVFRA
jgi:tyrosine-protein kinase Etk/Wzc